MLPTYPVKPSHATEASIHLGASASLALPEPSGGLTDANLVQGAQAVVEASWHLPLEEATELLSQALALEEYLAKRDSAGPIQTAARHLERRIGELVGPPSKQGGDHKTIKPVGGLDPSGVPSQRRGEFWLLADRWDYLWPLLPSTRAKLIREAKALALEEAASQKPKATTKPKPPPIEVSTRPRSDYPETIGHEQWTPELAQLARQAMTVRFEGGFNAQDTTSIEWAQWSWNPVTGCLHNCPYCYARDIAERYYDVGFTPVLRMKRLSSPLHHTPPERARTDLGYRNVFCCSMADLFGRWVPQDWIEMVLEIVAQAPKWNFLFLTKFPIRLSEFRFPDNAWVGTTVDCQARVANAERAFSKVQAKVKWLSVEPLLEPLKFKNLEVFDWIVLGGASRSKETPEWRPPFGWIVALDQAARDAGVEVYFKTNLLGDRPRGYPGHPHKAATIPKPLAYLPGIGD